MNDDLISRQAVTDLIMENDPWWCEGMTRTIFDCINQLPSVDAVPVIKCKDCKYFELDHFDNFCLPTENGEAVTVPIITSHEICSRWGDGCKTSEDGYCYLAERKEE